MSVVLVVQFKEIIYFGVDSAGSYLENGRLYRSNSDSEKAFIINRKMLAAGAGYSVPLRDFFYKCKLIRNTEMNTWEIAKVLKGIHKNVAMDFIKDTGKRGDKDWIFDVYAGFVGCDGHSVVFDFSPRNRFKAKEFTVSGDCFRVFTAHGRDGVDVGHKIIERIQEIRPLHLVGNKITKIFHDVINEIAYEGIGGTLTTYAVDRYGARLYSRKPITEKPDIKRLRDDHPYYAGAKDERDCHMQKCTKLNLSYEKMKSDIETGLYAGGNIKLLVSGLKDSLAGFDDSSLMLKAFFPHTYNAAAAEGALD